MKILKFVVCFLTIIKSTVALDLIYDNLDLASKNLDQNYNKLSESKKAKIGDIIEEMEELSQELVEISTYKEPVNFAKITVQSCLQGCLSINGRNFSKTSISRE